MLIMGGDEDGGVDVDGPEPIFRQIAAILSARIAAGVYPPNRKIPSESEICAEFDVSRKTARAATKLLSDAGLVRTVRGKGTYVVAPTGAAGDD